PACPVRRCRLVDSGDGSESALGSTVTPLPVTPAVWSAVELLRDRSGVFVDPRRPTQITTAPLRQGRVNRGEQARDGGEGGGNLRQPALNPRKPWGAISKDILSPQREPVRFSVFWVSIVFG